MHMRQWKPAVAVMALSFLWGAVTSLGAQSQNPKSDAEQIAFLIESLCNHSKTPTSALDPSLNPEDRNTNLKYFDHPGLNLSLTPTEVSPSITGDTASLPAKVHFDTKDENSLDTDATLHFVKRGGAWYFANFDFMSWPVLLIAVVVVSVLIGISYAATVLTLWSKLNRRGLLKLTGARIFVPFLWPSLFRQAR